MKNIIIKDNINHKFFNDGKTIDYGNVKDTIEYFQQLVQKTILSVQKYKQLHILGANELNIATFKLETIYTELSNLSNLLIIITDNTDVISTLQKLNEIRKELNTIFKLYGTENILDLLNICYGDDYTHNTLWDNNKYQLIETYFHPINFKIMPWKPDKSEIKPKNICIEKNKNTDDVIIVEKSDNLECFDLSRTSKTFHTKVYGVKIAFHNPKERSTIIVSGLIDDILTTCVTNEFINTKKENIIHSSVNESEYDSNTINRYIDSLTLKELLIYSNIELINKYKYHMAQLLLVKHKSVSNIVDEFIGSELYGQRNTLIQLLLKADDHEYQYIAYLLYDLLSTDNNGIIDSTEQTLLLDSLPWKFKNYFKDAMTETINYTNALSNFDNSKIPLEQQICLMKSDDSIKEKAMNKLKEIKSKTDDNGSKARTYLEGLLKIPFGIYKTEPILNIMHNIKERFKLTIDKVKKIDTNYHIEFDIDKLTNIQIKNTCDIIKNTYIINKYTEHIEYIIDIYTPDNRSELIVNICNINNIIRKNNMKLHKLSYSGKKIDCMKMQINNFINNMKNNETIIEQLYISKNISNVSVTQSIADDIDFIEHNWNYINTYMTSVKCILDDAVHGHEKAKSQIMRIIAQWINGEQKGYCFGFEGPPGLGKCMAKNTPIMLSNGKIKMVQDITTKDKLMGDDGTDRNVLALGSGREKMYRIEQIHGDDYVVNESHILSLKMTKAGRNGDKHQTILGKRYYKNDIVDICIKDYLELPKYLKECLKGYKVRLDYREQEVSLNPYAIGYWLGDRYSNNSVITTSDNEVIDYFTEYSNTLDLEIKQYVRSDTPQHDYHYQIKTKTETNNNSKNKFYLGLKQYNLINNKHIPDEYKLTSRENRLSLLAGLIDSGGYYNPNNSLEITQQNKVLVDDIAFLVRSLGMKAVVKESERPSTCNAENKCRIYYKTTISGCGLDEIPVLLKRKKARANKLIKNCLNTGIKLVPLEEDQYYGFQIDGNSRFLLGDFTVTHNTTFAKKGLAKCLVDENGTSRPFSFIAIGGQDNGSTLNGHNYTYVGSEWGKFVDILIKNKCMNPIIFIDELDKVSKTEHGKEIIGILTHLIDPTQNDVFQDKYFNGIELDLSKALFIFSYNDVSAIDKILLDRIHRIKFEHLSIEDKLVVTKKHILPEIYKNMGLCNCIQITDDNIIYIIENYTNEPGIRKFKELLFEIIGEINLSCLKNFETTILPIVVSNDDIKYKYLKDYHEYNPKKIPREPASGIINGLWANSMGQGGIIPIEAQYFPSTSFMELKLTGLQGDVMKESMTVAKTLASSLVEPSIMFKNIEQFEKTKIQGIHIHCPEGAVPKDGPSAGAAITCCIYSLLTGQKIKNNIAITGEINLQGYITAIGGLDLKILGGIKGGVTEFIFPRENKKDYDDFMELYKNKDLLINIQFHMVEHIQDVLKLIF